MNLDTAIALVHADTVKQDPHGAWSRRAAVHLARDAVTTADLDGNPSTISDTQIRDAYRIVITASVNEIEAALT